MGRGLAESVRRDNRTLPSPRVARPTQAALGAACILSPQSQIQALLSHQVFLWGTPSSFPDFLYGKPPRPPNSWHTDCCYVCIWTPMTPHPMTLLLPPCRPWPGWERSPCSLEMLPGAQQQTLVPSPWPRGTLPKPGPQSEPHPSHGQPLPSPGAGWSGRRRRTGASQRFKEQDDKVCCFARMC